MNVEVVLTPAEIALLPGRDLRGFTCVVFDVLRATSTMVTALFNGANRIFPVSTIAEALTLRETRLPGALLGGERGGKSLEGFDLGNSPREHTPEAVAGRDIISTTTNGTVALRACDGARTVLAGAFLNLRAVADHLSAHESDGERLLLVCAGTGERFALEDGLAAGALLGLLKARSDAGRPHTARFEMDDASVAMLALYKRSERRLLGAMQASENGRRLAELGLDGDIEWCARESPMDWIALMRNGVLEGQKVARGPG